MYQQFLSNHFVFVLLSLRFQLTWSFCAREVFSDVRKRDSANFEIWMRNNFKVVGAKSLSLKNNKNKDSKV